MFWPVVHPKTFEKTHENGDFQNALKETHKNASLRVDRGERGNAEYAFWIVYFGRYRKIGVIRRPAYKPTQLQVHLFGNKPLFQLYSLLDISMLQLVCNNLFT